MSTQGNQDTIDIVFDSNQVALDSTFTYINNFNLSPGSCCLCNFGNREILGYVSSVKHSNSESYPYSLKPVLTHIPELSLPDSLVQLWKSIAQEQLCSESKALTPFIPPTGKNRLQHIWEIANSIENIPLNTHEKSLLSSYFDGNSFFVENHGKKVDNKFKALLKRLWKTSYITRKTIINLTLSTRDTNINYTLGKSEEEIRDYINSYSKKRPAQTSALEILLQSCKAYFTIPELESFCSISSATIRKLIKDGLLVKHNQECIKHPLNKTLTSEQSTAVKNICSRIDDRSSNTTLLHGITGSGKTEVYLRCTHHALNEGKNVLLLVPEIALTAQLVGIFREHFGDDVAVLHSALSDNARLSTWIKTLKGEYKIVIGPRSALFSPLQDIGLIILDEEHDSSYKQETTPFYHSRSSAEKLAEIWGAALVLGSATPSIESYYQATNNKYHLEILSKRASASSLPSVSIENLVELYKSGKPSIIGPQLHSAITENLAKKEQTILFLNRRAYAPSYICRDCGFIASCPNCSVYLSFHKSVKSLKCHHCDFHTPAKEECESCKSSKIAAAGIGIEKVEEFIRSTYPEAKVARLDRDIARRKNVLSDTLSLFRQGEIDILIGTQIIAKGLDFPNVTLVGVLAADLSLSIPDYRSSENTFQLLTQVAGRAGRSNLPGRVVIQTFNTTHPAIIHATNQDYISFYNQAIEERTLTEYPPFTNLINIRLSHADKYLVHSASKQLADRLKSLSRKSKVLGPALCAVEKLANNWRYHILIKTSLNSDTSWIKESCETLSAQHPEISLSIDVKAGNLM